MTHRWMLALALTGLSGCMGHFADSTRVREPFQQSVAVTGTPTIQLDNIAGKVRISGWSKPTVEIGGEKTGPDQEAVRNINVDVHTNGSTVYVSTHYGDASHGIHFSSGGVNYTIHAPVGSNLKITNVAGTVNVDDIDGSVAADTQAGTIDASLPRFDGKHPVTLNVTTGSISLRIPKNSNAMVQAKSTVGSFTSDFGINSSRQNVGVVANGTIGTGGAPLKLTTTTGSIALKAQ